MSVNQMPDMSESGSAVTEKTQLWPKNYSDNLSYRINIQIKCKESPERMSLVKEECRKNILFWINSFVMTYNPRLTPAVIPFITYDFQDDFILDLVSHIENEKDKLIDKSRDMGVSWCVLTVFTWYWLFGGEGRDFLCGSRKEEYVDKIGDMKTLLQKIRFILKNTPKWLMPEGYREKEHATFMKILNPVTSSLISGESTNQQFSRGGRQLAILFDEFAFWDVDSSAWRSSASTTNCRIVVSTPHGFNNHFAKLRHSDSIEVSSFHWRLHPNKDDKWYKNECERRNHDKVEIAQELDISYEGSEEGILFSWDDLNRGKIFDEPLSLDRIVMSVDPSGTGKDEAIIYVCNNGAIVTMKSVKDITGNHIEAGKSLAAECILLIKKHRVQVVVGDAIGNDVLTLISMMLGDSKVKIITFKSSEKARDTAKYFNARAEAYHDASEYLLSGNLQVDDDYKLMKQLNATHYLTKNGKLIIEPKEKIKERCGSSPDRADAWVLLVQALKLTHSRREIEYQQTYRKRENYDTVMIGEEYGSWGDIEQGFFR